MIQDEPATDAADEVPPHFAPGARALVAEDNPTNQIIVVAMLRKLGLAVDTVENGLEAVEAVATLPYDIVLMDMQMPTVDGVEATRRIRQLPGPHGRVPIVGVTANGYRDDHLRCLEAGMQAVVTKPFRWADLARVMLPHIPLDVDLSPDDAQVADAAAWDKLLHDVGPDAARAITGVFLQDSRARLARIADHLAAGDVKRIGREAHALKSSVELLGFERMTRLTARIQKLAKETDEAGAVEGLARDLADAFVAVEALCRDRLDGSS